MLHCKESSIIKQMSDKTNQSTQQEATKSRLIRPDIYTEFILWTAMPPQEKYKLGIEHDYQFADHHHIDRVTLWRWKQRKDYEPRVDAILKVWSVGKTPDVIHGMYRAAVKGNPMSQMLWLQYFKKFNPKAADEAEQKKVEIGVNDIRFLIETLPEPLRTKHLDNLRQLIDDAQHLRHAGQLEDQLVLASGAEDSLQGEADHDAQNVPGKRANEMASRDKARVCADMGRKVSTYNYQSAERWW